MATRTATIPAPVTTVPGPVQVPTLPHLPAVPVAVAPSPAPLTERDRLNKQTLKDLKELAKTRGLKGYSTKRKPELVEMLLAGGTAPPVGGATTTMTIPQLKEAIKARGGKGYSGKSKAELQTMLAALPQ